MGAYLDEWYGPDHVAVGFALDRGEYTAVGQGTGLGTHELHPGPTGSYEAVFSRGGMPRFVLDLRAARRDDPASGWLHSPMQFRNSSILRTWAGCSIWSSSCSRRRRRAACGRDRNGTASS
jgi:erythromycin esterase-like protein